MDTARKAGLAILLLVGFADLAFINLSLAPQVFADTPGYEITSVDEGAVGETAGAVAMAGSAARDTAASAQPAGHATVPSDLPEAVSGDPAPTEPPPEEVALPEPIEEALPEPVEESLPEPSEEVAVAEEVAAPEAAPAPEATPAGGGHGSVLFWSDNAAIGPQGRRILLPLVQMATRRGGARVLIEGHTDQRGDSGHNERLSWRRAQAVARFFSRRGVPNSRLEVVGHGDRQPLDTGTGSDADARNRRVEIGVE